ncbi:MAG: NAD-dependent epimerase/dehydratase family protein [Candidatus Hydrogenedentota bacterium]
MAGKALVTGAHGFVGRHLCRYLETREWEVLRTDRGMEAESGRACELTNAEETGALAVWAEKPDCVFHLAALSFLPDADSSPLAAFDVNLRGTLNLTEALIRHAPDTRFLFIGSAASYGVPHVLPVTEDHPLAPGNPYAISKTAADHYCAYLDDTGRLDTVRLRPFNHSGPGQPPHFVLSSLAKQIAAIEHGQQEPVIRVGNLHAARDFTHVKDVIRAYELAARHGATGQAYNICSGRAWSIEETLNLFLRRTQVSVEVTVEQSRQRASDVREVVGSHAKFTSLTKWRPDTPFERILDDLLLYWRQHFSR